MPEINFTASTDLKARITQLCKQLDWTEAEAWQYFLLLGLARLEQQKQLVDPGQDWAVLADKLKQQLLDVQTGYSRVTQRRYELEHDLMIMEMRRNALEIELAGMQQALARCRKERLDLLAAGPPEPLPPEGLAGRLRKAVSGFFGTGRRKQ